MTLKILFRSIMLSFVILFTSLSALTACGASTPPPQQHLLSPTDIARQIGAYYGDPHAQINGKVHSDVTDNPPHDPMYIMRVVGNFHKGTLKAHSIGFSALATRMYVWNIYAYDEAGRQMWHDLELPLH